jgi:hypothetical protein
MRSKLALDTTKYTTKTSLMLVFACACHCQHCIGKRIRVAACEKTDDALRRPASPEDLGCRADVEWKFDSFACQSSSR